MTEVKRNHHLPRFYLEGWADETGRVALRRRGETQAVLTSVGNVGVRNGFYTPQAEGLFGRTETAAAPVVKHVLDDVRALDSRENRSEIARFMVELMARQTYMATFLGLSPETTQEVLAAKDDLASVLRTLRSEFGPRISEQEAEFVQYRVQGFYEELGKKFPDAPSDEIESAVLQTVVDSDASRTLHSSVVEHEDSDLINGQRSEQLLAREWLVCESTGKEFITSDQPVFKHPTWIDRNMISPQDTLCFVVSPRILLKMGRESGKCQWGEKEVHQLNLYIAEHCDHQVIATPSNEKYLSQISLGKHRPWAFAESSQPPRMSSRVTS